MEFINQEDPRFQELDKRTQEFLFGVIDAMKIEPVSTAGAVIVLLARQLALLGPREAGMWFEALSREVRNSFNDENASYDRVGALAMLVENGKRLGAQMQADLVAARQSNQVS